MAITTIPPTFYQVAFNADPSQSTIPPYWTDQSWRAQFQWTSGRGRQYELDAVETGEWRPVLANSDGALDPSNTASPYWPNVIPFRQARVQCKPGPNQLTPDQATAGEATGYPPGITAPTQMAVSNDFGYPVTLTASGSAYQGSQVYQVTLPGGATQFTTILLVKPVPAVPAVTYTFSAQVRIPSGTSTPTSATILWYNTAGANISSIAGGALTPTSGSSTWNQISVSGAAPAGAYSAVLKIQIASGGSTSAQTVWQADGLQLEQNPFASPFQVPFTPCTNLLPGNLASGGYDAQSATGWWYPAAGTVSYATGLTAAPTGHTNAFAWTTPAGITNTSPLLAGASASGPVADIVQVTAGAAYSASFYALRASSADVTLAVTATLTWYGAAATSLGVSVGSPLTLATGSWGRLTVSGTAPAGAVWARIQVAITAPAPTTASNTVYLTAGQFEAAASPTSWRDTGTTYSVITPFIERWPQTWSEQEGTYGTSNVIGDDAFAALAQYTLRAPFVQEILAMGPDFFYQLSDPAGSTSVTDSAGKRIACPIENSPYGPGSLVLGSSITAANAALAFLGTTGPVATFNNNPSQGNSHEAQTYLALHETTLTPGPPSPALTGGIAANPAWTRMIAFRAPSIPASGNFPTLWMVQAPTYSSDLSFYLLYVNPATGTLSFQESSASGTGPLFTSAGSVCDGNWHQVAICYTGGTSLFFDIYLDGARVFHDNNSGGGWLGVSSVATDVVGANVVVGRNAYVSGWVGDVAQVIQFPFALSTTQATNLYASWRTASSGESTGARMQRILKWIGWTGTAAIDTGQTASMGPATDLTGATALDAANNVTLTEAGNWYTAANGTLTFKARTARYNQLTPAYIFGESTAVGEWPFENPFQFDDDSSHIANNVQVTQYGGAVYTALDAASAGRYFPRVYQRTINTTSAAECQDAANYLLGQYKDAHMRVSALRLHPSAVPGLFQVCLSLELGTRIRVNRRPNGGPQITFDGFVEKIEWEWDPDTGDVWVNLQCSPADLANYWLLAALHTTLNAQASSGQNQATINALPDSAVNPLAASLPQGYQLVFEPGTTRQETMTLTATGIPATSPGYFTATLTFTANFAFTHPAGSTVCEVLPQGYTDPTTWDGQSVLGAAFAPIVSGGGAGSNTVTVGPLPDGAVNPLGSTWNVGDLLHLSPGTPNWEGYNLCTPNQATAGEGVLPLAAGSSGAAVGITADVGTPTVTASASAFQGANVWQVACGASVSTPTGLLYLLKVPAAAGVSFTGSVYTRSITTGANPVVSLYLKFLDGAGNSLAQFNSSNSTLTGSPTAAWTRLTASGLAPAATVWVQMGVLLQTAPSVSWNFQADALQVEPNAAARAFCVTPQIKSVAASTPGYTVCVITLNTNLINSHSVGDTVCDPLPPSVTSPPPSPARLAY